MFIAGSACKLLESPKERNVSLLRSLEGRVSGVSLQTFRASGTKRSSAAVKHCTTHRVLIGFLLSSAWPETTHELTRIEHQGVDLCCLTLRVTYNRSLFVCFRGSSLPLPNSLEMGYHLHLPSFDTLFYRRLP
jgi:hypothetical protein